MAMGSPLSLVITNGFMKEFKEKAVTEAPHPTKFWGKYVDDTGVVIRKEHEDDLFQNNQQHNNIKFTIKQDGEDKCLPMLDVHMI